MIQKEISLSSIDSVKKFVNVVNMYDFEVDLVSGRYTINAKSIMGIFSLDLTQPITMQVHEDDCAKFLEEISNFIV